MPLKNGNTVAVERRVDLASLFCMIGRHGPVVALAVIAMVSVLAGLVIYRIVRGKRRKATVAAAEAEAAADGDGDGDGDGESPAGAEGDASVMREWHHSVESTVNDEGSSDVKQDVDLTQSDLRIRHRHAAAERTPAPCSPPESGIRAPGFERTAVDDTEEAARHVAAMHAEEAIKGASEEFHASCLKEPEPMDADHHEQGAATGPLSEVVCKVSAAECQEDEGVTPEEDVFDETPRREDNFQCALNDPVCFQLTSNMSDDGKDEEFERESKDGNTRLSPEGESRNESEEAEEHRLDHLLIGQLAEVQSSAFQRESNLPSVTDEAPPPVGDSNCEEDCGPAGEGGVREAPLAQFAERAVEIGLSGTVGIAKFADLSLDRQPPHKEDDTVPSLDEDTNSTILHGDVTAVVLAEEHVDRVPSHRVSRLDTWASSLDQESDQTQNDDEDFSDVAVVTEVLNPRSCQIDLPSFEQFALRDYDVSCAGVGEESGISSMTVTPDAGIEYDVIFGNVVLPLMDCDLKSEGQKEAQTSLFADDADISVIKEDTAGMVFGPRPSHSSRPPCSERAAWTIYESFASSQDTFGHEIEDSYYRAVDQFVAQIADRVTCATEKKSNRNVVVESKEKKKEGSVDMKEATKAGKEKEEDYEKTEISIMEATMDHNEWIMDGNYQAFPWMNLSASSCAPDDTKSNQLPSEECQDFPAEVQQDGTLSLADESFVVVQPTAQNVDVTFSVHYVTQSPYQTVAIMGNQQELGNWKGFVPLENAKDGHWVTVVSLPAESYVEWKFVVVDKGEVCRWEECGNRLLDTGSGDELMVHKCWARL